MIQKLVLNAQMISKIFIKILKNTIQIGNIKYWLYLMLCYKKLNPVVTELFIRERKLNISLVFIPKSYCAIPENIRLNSAHYFVMKIRNKRELQEIAFNHSSDIGFRDLLWIFMKNVLQNLIPFSYWYYPGIR